MSRYGVMELLSCPYPGRPQNLPAYQVEFNRAMKILRVAVECKTISKKLFHNLLS
jgi:hypothetical protein